LEKVPSINNDKEAEPESSLLSQADEVERALKQEKCNENKASPPSIIDIKEPSSSSKLIVTISLKNELGNKSTS